MLMRKINGIRVARFNMVCFVRVSARLSDSRFAHAHENDRYYGTCNGNIACVRVPSCKCSLSLYCGQLNSMSAYTSAVGAVTSLASLLRKRVRCGAHPRSACIASCSSLSATPAYES